MHIKYWQSLLSEWRKLGRDGLTLPFILGSQQFLNMPMNLDIKDLLEDIATSNEFSVYISYCITINEIIIGIRDDTKQKIAGRFLRTSLGSLSNLFLTTFLNDLGDNVDEVGSSLTERYQHILNEKKFSINNKEWGDFSENEIKFIQSCFHKM